MVTNNYSLEPLQQPAAGARMNWVAACECCCNLRVKKDRVSLVYALAVGSSNSLSPLAWQRRLTDPS